LSSERELVDFTGNDVLGGEGSNDSFDSKIPSALSVHELNATGSLGSPLSAEPFPDDDCPI
jgi:hypothetical protein